MKQRYGYIDDVKAVGISMIVLSHIFGAKGLGENPLWRWFEPFMVAVFFLVSGYLFFIGGTAQKYTLKQFVKKRAVSLLIPFLTFSGATAVIRLAVAHLANQPVGEAGLTLLREFVTLLGTGTLWFLPVLFLAEVLVFLSLNENRGMRLILFAVSAVIVCANPLVRFFYRDLWICDYLIVISRALAAAGLILLGYWLLPLVQKYGKSGGASAAVIAASFLVTILISAFYKIDFRSLNFERYPILLFVDGAAGTVFLMECFREIEKKCPLRLLQKIGQSSLIIMGTHSDWYLLLVAHLGLAGILGACPVIGPRYYAEAAAVYVLVMLMEYGIVSLIRGYAPWAVGEKRVDI